MQSTGNRNALRQNRTVANGGTANVTIERKPWTGFALFGAVLFLQVSLFAYCFAVRQDMKLELVQNTYRLEGCIKEATKEAVERAIAAVNQKTP